MRHRQVTRNLIMAVAASLLAASLASCGVSSGARPSPPKVVDGTIDLADWDFAASGSVLLDGDWEFE